MFVLVPFGKVQPDADAHQAGCHPEAWRGNSPSISKEIAAPTKGAEK
jgi:hypothetical protein